MKNKYEVQPKDLQIKVMLEHQAKRLNKCNQNSYKSDDISMYQ